METIQTTSGFLTFRMKLVRDVQPVHHPQDTQTKVGVEGVTREQKSKRRRESYAYFVKAALALCTQLPVY